MRTSEWVRIGRRSTTTHKARKAIAALTAEMDAAKALDDVDTDKLTDAEREFVRLARRKDKTPVRHGWPDFLVLDDGGAAIGIEVKQAGDTVTANQAAMFRALEERVGLRVFVWNPQRPKALTPWASYRPLSPLKVPHPKRQPRPRGAPRRVDYRFGK